MFYSHGNNVDECRLVETELRVCVDSPGHFSEPFVLRARTTSTENVRRLKSEAEQVFPAPAVAKKVAKKKNVQNLQQQC